MPVTSVDSLIAPLSRAGWAITARISLKVPAQNKFSTTNKPSISNLKICHVLSCNHSLRPKNFKLGVIMGLPTYAPDCFDICIPVLRSVH